MQTPKKTIPILLVIIATILIVAALKATYAITMPLAFAFFIAVLVHPLQRWLNHYLPRWLSLLIVMLALAAVVGLAISALELSAEIIEPKAPEYLDRLQEILQTATSWLQDKGFPVNLELFKSQSSINRVTNEALGRIKSLISALSLFVLVISLLVLLLLEVGQYRRKIERSFSSRTSTKIIKAVASMSEKLRGYLLVVTFTSVITGVLTGLWCLLLGVDFAFVWGLIAFILNYVPTLGSIIAVIPPTLLALLFQGVGRGIATLIGLAILQVIIGNFVDPRLQGRSLQISPFIALFSIVFWGWVWGIPGALLGVPMTVSIIVLCKEFESTRPIAILLGELDDPDLQKPLK